MSTSLSSLRECPDNTVRAAQAQPDFCEGTYGYETLQRVDLFANQVEKLHAELHQRAGAFMTDDTSVTCRSPDDGHPRPEITPPGWRQFENRLNMLSSQLDQLQATIARIRP